MLSTSQGAVRINEGSQAGFSEQGQMYIVCAQYMLAVVLTPWFILVVSPSSKPSPTL